MAKIKVIYDDYIIGIGENPIVKEGITQKEYDELTNIFRNKPTAPDGFHYMLRADNLNWELVENPTEEPEEEGNDDE